MKHKKNNIIRIEYISHIYHIKYTPLNINAILKN